MTDDPDRTIPGSLVPDTEQPVPADSVQPGPVEPGLSPLTDRAIADLGARLDVDVSTVDVIVAQAVVWPDSSLGCPVSGMEYLQVLTDGFRIVLGHDGASYSYHGGGSRNEPFLCERPGKPIPGASANGEDI